MTSPGSAWYRIPSRLLIQPPIIAVIVIGIAMSIATNRFLTWSNLENLAWETSVVGIMAIGSTLVIITAGIDLSPGAALAVVSMTIGYFVTSAGLGVFWAIVLSILLGAFLGLVNGALVAWLRIAPFIATLGTMTAYQGIASLYNNNAPYFNISTGLESLFYGTFLGISLPIWYLVVLYVLAWLYLRYTSSGRSIYIVGGNPTAARLSGISISRTLVITYTLAGLLAGFAGVLMTAQLNSGSADYGQSGLELQAIAAAVIGGASLFGGTGKIGLSLAGSVIIAEIENGFALLGVPATWQDIALGIIIVLAVALDSWRDQFSRLRLLFRNRGRGVGLVSPYRAALADDPATARAVSDTGSAPGAASVENLPSRVGKSEGQ